MDSAACMIETIESQKKQIAKQAEIIEKLKTFVVYISGNTQYVGFYKIATNSANEAVEVLKEVEQIETKYKGKE